MDRKFPRVAGNISFVLIPKPEVYYCLFYVDEECLSYPLLLKVGSTHLVNENTAPNYYNEKIISYRCERPGMDDETKRISVGPAAFDPLVATSFNSAEFAKKLREAGKE
ncbi:hypothetical protein PVAG01_03192 [Phlyctema vagabunda]|uniref:Uncharacterized protein n=1 Tax=Phlyctema vagabunda TaxID=108571 RepID=A0ABR4PT03_9HELO